MYEVLGSEEELLSSELLKFSSEVVGLVSPCDVLDGLHAITSTTCRINIQGAFHLPSSWGDLRDVEMGKNIFIHTSVPEGWWEDYFGATREKPSPTYAMAQLASAPFTLTEAMHSKDPIGSDRWAIELHQKYGMRDYLVCPTDGRWIILYWSADVLTKRLTSKLRALLHIGAALATVRLQKIRLDQISGAKSVQNEIALTPREDAVLRSLSLGNRTAEIAKHLGIGSETVRSHLKKAQAKLGTRTLPHTVSQAIRQRLFP